MIPSPHYAYIFQPNVGVSYTVTKLMRRNKKKSSILILNQSWSLLRLDHHVYLIFGVLYSHAHSIYMSIVLILNQGVLNNSTPSHGVELWVKLQLLIFEKNTCLIQVVVNGTDLKNKWLINMFNRHCFFLKFSDYGRNYLRKQFLKRQGVQREHQPVFRKE